MNSCCNACISNLAGNTGGSLEKLSLSVKNCFNKIIFLTKNPYSTSHKGKNAVNQTLKIPHWIENPSKEFNCIENTELSSTNQSKILKKIRPFRLNQLSVFNSNPYNLSKPITKNPVLKHLWKLRIHSCYRKGSPKRLVVNSNVVRHIFLHTDTSFEVILTTRKELIDFVLSNPSYNDRYSRIQLVDKRTLQYCLRGTQESYETVDAIAEAYIPQENKGLSPRFVVALDNIKYTKNLGSLIRSSVALGVDLIYYLRGTTDPFNWKVSSVTGGLQYLLPHRFGEVGDLRRFCKEFNLVPVVAHLEGDPLESLNISGGGVCLILGNESEGPSADVLKFAKRISLFMHPLTDSLNVSVAGAIIIHQLKNKILDKKVMETN